MDSICAAGTMGTSDLCGSTSTSLSPGELDIVLSQRYDLRIDRLDNSSFVVHDNLSIHDWYQRDQLCALVLQTYGGRPVLRLGQNMAPKHFVERQVEVGSEMPVESVSPWSDHYLSQLEPPPYCAVYKSMPSPPPYSKNPIVTSASANRTILERSASLP